MRPGLTLNFREKFGSGPDESNRGSTQKTLIPGRVSPGPTDSRRYLSPATSTRNLYKPLLNNGSGATYFLVNSSKSSSKEPVARLNGLNGSQLEKSDQQQKEIIRQTGTSKCAEEASQSSMRLLDGVFLNQVQVTEENMSGRLDDYNQLRKENAELKERIRQLESDQELVLQLNQMLLEKLHLFSDDFFSKPLNAL